MMKKCVVLILLSALLTGCDTVESADYNPYSPYVSTHHVKFNLIEDPNTGILYIDNTFDYEGGQPGHVYVPYYSENGKLCRLNDGKIVEVTEHGGE